MIIMFNLLPSGCPKIGILESIKLPIELQFFLYALGISAYGHESRPEHTYNALYLTYM